ncbi:cytochrome bd oxidase small subunit, CydX/CbdX family [Photobacterium angustum]|nr:cytochrome bd oxidase small subunit, CydX/CbdX family [Photobacterium angustum]PSV95500.1 cytochrome bd oxidase small subunit, CydX/CbdX family [Photobacterium angustum]PSW78948.1 cytochrome bd oxidase small subunit, CydX/CbdX family [Photobacterium angustum]
MWFIAWFIGILLACMFSIICVLLSENT